MHRAKSNRINPDHITEEYLTETVVCFQISLYCPETMDKENSICQTSGVEKFPLKRTPTESSIRSIPERKANSNQKIGDIVKLSMDSFVTVRPPRGRRYSEAVASNETVHIHHHPSKEALLYRHRSSSQPRSSKSVEPLPPRQMESSIRSVSQPRLSQNTHFLDGFNVADCYDVRTIPDPPAPSSSNSKRRHRRLVSSTVLRPMSSMDVNNRGNNQISISNHINGGDIKSSFVTRRKRKTLSHVPAPLNPEGDEKCQSDPVVSIDLCGTEERCDAEARPNLLQLGVYSDDGEDEDEDETAKQSPKRNKKRQSIVIPRHLPLEGNCSSNNALVNETSREIKNAKNSPSKEKKEFVPLDFNSMRKLRSLVKGYCALSSGNKQGSSEVKEILSMTGYALPQKASITDVGNKSESILSNRRLVIQKISPVLVQMESRKKQDIKQWENKTQCRVTKSERSGRYKYYDVESNQKVGSQEYKRRYISVLEDERPNRLLRARQWIDELNKQQVNHCAWEDPQEFVYSDRVDMSRQEQNDVDIIEMQQKEAFLPPRNINIVRDGTTRDRDTVPNECDQKCGDHQSDLLLNTSGRGELAEIAEITEASSEDTDDNSRESISLLPIKSNTSEIASSMIIDDILPRPERKDPCDNIHLGNDVVGEDVTGYVPLLPLPSKDSESKDSDIAAAEKRLWDKIDLALHEYSGEVVAIKKKKRRLA